MTLQPLSPRYLATLFRFGDVQWSQHRLLWSESRGPVTLLRAWHPQTGPQDVIRDPSLRSGVGYGGGEFGTGPNSVVFVAKGRLYRQDLPHGFPRAITPAFGGFASPTLSPDGQWVLFVHTYEDQDVLAVVPADGSQWPQAVAQGADFYMQPAWHPRMRYMAWVEWDFPQMPWDGTRLKLAQWDRGKLLQVRHLDGDRETPVFQPAFSPDGRYLAYLKQHQELDALYLYDLETGQRRPLLVERVLVPPAWVQGMRAYTWVDSQRLLVLENREGWSRAWWVSVHGQVQKFSLDPYTWVRQPAASPDGSRVAFLASSSSRPEQVVIWGPEGFQVVARSGVETLPPELLVEPEALRWTGAEGSTRYGLYYPPAPGTVAGDEPPRAVVSVHGGPTSQRVANFNPQALFFTSRGYAYVELNYRGSTGYGRAYMLALRERWGEADVEDAVSLARFLVESGRAHPRRMAILGGSAGGFTVLNVLIHYPEVYRVGIALFPVTDLAALNRSTHKFERHYLESLVGPWPQAAERYRERSPLYHVSRLRTPLALFQGEEDRVVPPEQAQRLAEELRRLGVPYVFRLYPGEGHGFRKPETVEDLYHTIEKFLEEHCW